MFVFGFIESNTWLVLTLSGLIGFLYSGERVLSILPFWGDLEDKQTRIMKLLSIIMGVVAAVWMSLLIVDEVADFRWLTIVLLIVFMIVSLSHPVRSLEGWAVVLLAIPFILVTILALWFRGGKNFSIFGNTISLWSIMALVTIIMLLLFILVFFIEESIVDPILFFLGWAPVVFVVCVLILVHGIALFFEPVEGLHQYLGI